MQKLKMHSVDGVARNIEKIGELFPNAVTEVLRDGKVERAVDFDVLRQELSDVIVEGREERYQFTWPGKNEAKLRANLPISAALRPVEAESVGRDGTPGGFDSENLYIEGDNLDVLKLLRETYLGKVKMIYIDPPYNTGGDFIYNDKFAAEKGEYMANSGQFDEEGNRMTPNLESNGRFHTDWLNMIYPRLKVAKDLLADDGVIFISIDDNEIENLKKICNEIFGENNFICVYVWQSKKGGGSDNSTVVSEHEYILCYAKVISSEHNLNRILIDAEPLDREDERGKYRRGRELNKWGANSRREDRPTMFFPIQGPNKEEVYPIRNDGAEGCWRWGRDKMLSAVENKNVEFVARDNGTYIVYEKIRDSEPRLKPYRTLLDDVGITADGSKLIKTIFDDLKVFDFPKPTDLIKKILEMGCSKNGLILDFFSGSATTAHAVMQLNAEDGGKRKFIMVQLPEACAENSEAYKAGYKNVCEIGKERIRRAGKKIKEESPLTTQDIDVGFRCLRLDTSNMKDVYYRPDELRQEDLFAAVDNVKEGRGPEDLLFQAMLELGAELSAKIDTAEIAGKKVFNVADNYLLACFDTEVTDETVAAMAKMKPQYAVLRDNSMKSDSVAANFEQIFKTYSPDTTLRVL